MSAETGEFSDADRVFMLAALEQVNKIQHLLLNIGEYSVLLHRI